MLSQFSTKTSSGVRPSPEAAGEIAISALGYIAQDSEILGKFMDQSGLEPDRLRAAASDPAFLANVLEFLCANEPELLAFSANCGLTPQAVDNARKVLNGPDGEWSA